MPIYRFSATEIEGVPLDLEGNADFGLKYMMNELKEHDIAGVPLGESSDYPIDITPPYWTKNNYRYFLTLVKKEMARIDLMPVHADSAVHELSRGGKSSASTSYPVTPQHSPFTVVGPRPNTSIICLHELVIGVPPELFE